MIAYKKEAQNVVSLMSQMPIYSYETLPLKFLRINKVSNYESII